MGGGFENGNSAFFNGVNHDMPSAGYVGRLGEYFMRSPISYQPFGLSYYINPSHLIVLGNITVDTYSTSLLTSWLVIITKLF